MEEKGRIYHLWPTLIHDRRTSLRLLNAHYE
jgi:hypothetical protein